MLFIFYLGLWNSQIITMKTISPVAKFSICWRKCSPRAWALQQNMLFMSSCNLLVLKESKKNCGDCFLQGSGSGTVMMALFLFQGFIQQRNAVRQLHIQLCDHWFRGRLQFYLHSSRCRISSWSLIVLSCACNKARLKTALYYIEKKRRRGKEEK